MIDAVQPNLAGQVPEPPPERMIGDVALSSIPTAAYRLVYDGDPFPMPRAKTRIVKPPGREPFAQIYTPSGARKGEETAQARQAAIEATWRAEGFPLIPAGVPVAIGLLFVFARPDGHYGTGRNRFTVKPRFEHVRPGGSGNRNGKGQRTSGDIDNLEKLVTDALQGAAYFNDSQIAHTDFRDKLFLDQAQDGGLEPRTLIQVRAFVPRP